MVGIEEAEELLLQGGWRLGVFLGATALLWSIGCLLFAMIGSWL